MGSFPQILDPYRETLENYAFDSDRFHDFQERLRSGKFEPSDNLIESAVKIPEKSAFVDDSCDASSLQLGQEALADGKAALVILNGGMATRFGGVVKGTVNVMGHLSFLGLRIKILQKLAPKCPIFLLNSFATHSQTLEHLSANDYFGCDPSLLYHLKQNISVRLTPGGEIFLDASGRPSFYAPGHGDVFSALAKSQDFQNFAKQKKVTVMVVNVDNIFADLSPEIVGRHLKENKPVSVEVAPQYPGDRGGAPLYVNDRLQIIEAFRLPQDFPHEKVDFFNTNTLLFQSHLFNQEYPLTWFRVDKTVDQQAVVQFEHLMGEITTFYESSYLRVSRDEKNCRFWPIKTQEDLKGLENRLYLRYPWLTSN
tara:strand:+ start:205 stop:1308 length:1104 start_codon:yes stop_codon:yes gene_type:complete